MVVDNKENVPGLSGCTFTSSRPDQDAVDNQFKDIVSAVFETRHCICPSAPHVDDDLELLKNEINEGQLWHSQMQSLDLKDFGCASLP